MDTELAPKPVSCAAAALVVTVAVHLWRHNAVLSILAGTGAYVALMSLL